MGSHVTETGAESGKVGPDLVRVSPARMTVLAAREMPDWRVTRFRPTVVLHGGATWKVVGASPRRGTRKWCYRLEPWNSETGGLPGAVVQYDEGYVARRESASSGMSAVAVALVPALWVAGPLIGFLPCKWKLSLERRFDKDPAKMTLLSFTIEIPVFLACIVGSLFSTECFVAVFPLAADLALRGDRLMKGGGRQYGILEWAFRRISSASFPARTPTPPPARGTEAEAPADENTHDPPLREAAWGPDRVVWTARGTRVETGAEMPEWRASAHRKTRVILDGRAYCVSSVQKPRPGFRVYNLQAWPDAGRDIPSATVVYDEGYVFHRERAAREQRAETRASLAVWLACPLWGFLPSAFLERMEERWGVEAADSVKFSLFLEFGLALATGFHLGMKYVFATGGGALSTTFKLLWAVFWIFSIDWVFRFFRWLDRDCLGFGEWLFRLFRPRR